jgi:hypothetical protein
LISGLDPIISQQNVDPEALALDPTKDDHVVIGAFPGEETTPLTIPQEFVVSRGGEYFFSPSLAALASSRFSLPPPIIPEDHDHPTGPHAPPHIPASGHHFHHFHL